MNRRSFLKIFFGTVATVVVAPTLINTPKAIVISRTGISPNKIIQGQEILVPTFEIASNPTIQLSEIKARRFYIVDRAQIKAKEAMQKEEDTKTFRAIEAEIRKAA